MPRTPLRLLTGVIVIIASIEGVALAGNSDRPDWIDNRPADNHNFIGIGFAQVTTDKAMARDAADANARRNLAAEISVNVEAVVTNAVASVESDKTSAFLEQLETSNRQIISQSVEGAVIAHRWYDERKREWYSYATLSRDEFMRGLTARMEAAAAAARKLEDETGKALESLVREAIPAGKKALIYNVTFEDDGFASPMGRYIENLLLQKAIGTRLFDVYPRSKFDQAAREKGAAIGDLKGEPVDFVVTGAYFVDSREMNLFLRVADAATGNELASRSCRIPRDALPAGIGLASAGQMAAAKATIAPVLEGARAGQLRVQVTPDRGNGATYRDGEKMVIMVKANKDCFVKVFMVTADQHTVLIFPNRFDANNRITAGKPRLLGNDSDGFKFTVSKPYGVEALKVVASSVQFDDYQFLQQKFKAGQDFDIAAATDVKASRTFQTRGLSVARQEVGAEVAENSSTYSVTDK